MNREVIHKHLYTEPEMKLALVRWSDVPHSSLGLGNKNFDLSREQMVALVSILTAALADWPEENQ